MIHCLSSALLSYFYMYLRMIMHLLAASAIGPACRHFYLISSHYHCRRHGVFSLSLGIFAAAILASRLQDDLATLSLFLAASLLFYVAPSVIHRIAVSAPLACCHFLYIEALHYRKHQKRLSSLSLSSCSWWLVAILYRSAATKDRHICRCHDELLSYCFP